MKRLEAPDDRPGSQSVCRPEVLTLVEYSAGKTAEAAQRELGLARDRQALPNESPPGPSPRVLEAITAALPRLAMYPEKSFIDLKTTLADANGVRADNICVGHGSETIIQIIPQLRVNPGDEVVLADANYGRYEEASKLMGARLVRVPLRELRFDLEAMAAAMTPRTRIVWICNPNNPTGTFVTRDEMQRFIEVVPPSVTVVFDQAYIEFADDPDYTDALEFLKAGHDNVIVLRTFSKVYGLAGIRLGYGIAAPGEAAAPRLHQGAVQPQPPLDRGGSRRHGRQGMDGPLHRAEQAGARIPPRQSRARLGPVRAESGQLRAGRREAGPGRPV